MSASNITMLIPDAAGEAQSFQSMVMFASSLLWGSVELVISIGIITAYAHVLCYAVGLVLRDEQSLEHSNDPDLPQKEQTAALMLTGFLAGIHLMLVFFGLAVFGHESDSFFMKLLFSCAILAAVTTGLIVGGTILYLVVPAMVSCVKSMTMRVNGTPKIVDVEEAASESKQPFLIEKELE